MTPLESSVWATLYSAGNDADNWLGKLLRQEGDFRENMEILAEDLSHQLSYYSATAYVLPHLAALCPQLLLEDQVFLVAQMGAAIAAEADRPLEPDSDWSKARRRRGCCRRTQKSANNLPWPLWRYWATGDTPMACTCFLAPAGKREPPPAPAVGTTKVCRWQRGRAASFPLKLVRGTVNL